jgi:hypothetical protein
VSNREGSGPADEDSERCDYRHHGRVRSREAVDPQPDEAGDHRERRQAGSEHKEERFVHAARILQRAQEGTTAPA